MYRQFRLNDRFPNMSIHVELNLATIFSGWLTWENRSENNFLVDAGATENTVL